MLKSIKLVYHEAKMKKRKTYIALLDLTREAMGKFARELVKIPLGDINEDKVKLHAAPTFELNTKYIRYNWTPTVKLMKLLKMNNWKLDMVLHYLNKRHGKKDKAVDMQGRAMKQSDLIDRDDLYTPLEKNPLADVSQIANQWSEDDN